MKRLVLFLLVAFCFSNAIEVCEDLDRYQNEVGNLTIEEQVNFVYMASKYANYMECMEEGEGASFWSSNALHVKKCGGKSSSGRGYVQFTATCNACTAEWVKEELKQIESDCREDCRESNYTCPPPSLPQQWGGEIVKINPNGGSCGAPLSNCSISSSSVGEDEQSSSSQELLSSDSQYSSFEVESSSSEEYDPESSDSGINSSSSDDGGDDPSSSSGERTNGDECYIGSNESCSLMDYVVFEKRPVLVGDIRLYYHKPYCKDGDIVFSANIPAAYFQPKSFECLNEYCTFNRSFEGFWVCDEGYRLINGCSVTPQHGSQSFFYSVLTNKLRTYWETVDFSANPESEISVPFFDVNELLNLVVESGVDAQGDDGNEDLKDLYPQFSINSFDDYVRACAYHLNIDISSSSVTFQSSSSVIAKSSSSSYMSSSSEESSSSVEESSSSYECSSSDCGDGISSSSQEEFSSSSDELVSSGSVDVEESSSSQQIESSSSEFVYSSSSDGRFVSGGDQVHSLDQIFNDGLDNMEPGSCYSLNPDRGTQYGWMNTDAKDSWWWREVDCESGEKVDRNRVGVCPGFPLDKVPSNPKRSCVAYDGRCYRCKSENSYVDCSQEWLWKWSFNVQNIGTWYAEVDCYNPFEDDDNDGLCPDGNVLMKTATVINNMEKINYNDISADYLSVVKFYDVLGRRFNGNRSKFLKTFKKQENKIERVKVTAFDVGSVIYIPIEDLGLSRNYLAKEGQTCQPYSCGNIGKDYGVNGDVGVYCGYPCTELIEEKGHLRIEISNKMRIGSCGENKSKYTITFKLPAKTTIKRKNVYYVVPIGHKIGNNIVTEDDYNAGKRHEIGHMESYSCLEKNKMFKSEYVFVLKDVCEDEFVCNKKGVIKGLADSISKSITGQRDTAMNELVKYNKNLWQKMCGWYHKTFSRYDGPGGFNKPQKVDCPTTDTLLEGKYDLAGCEVIE